MSAISSPAEEAQLRDALGRRVITVVGRLPLSVWLGGLVVVSAALRFAIAFTAQAPWIVPDELIYTELAGNLASTGHFVVRDASFAPWTYGPLYPVLIAPAYLATSTAAGALLVVKALNCLLFSLAGIPAYALARRVLRSGPALAVAALTLLVPSAVYTTKVMTESLAYPIFLVAMLAIVRVVERPSPRRELLALAAIGFAVAVRAEMVMLLPGLLSGIVLCSATEPRGRGQSSRSLLQRLGVFRTTWTVVVLAAVLVPAAALASGRSPTALLGAHSVLLDRVRPLEVPKWLVYHLADLDLYTGVAPLIAFVLVFGRALRRPDTSRALRAFAACSIAVSFWLLALVSLYGTQPRATPHVFDRYLFYIVPLFLIALLLWIEEGLPRPSIATKILAVVAVVLPATLPYASLFDGHEWGTSSSTVGLVPWFWLGLVAGHGLLLKAIISAFCASIVLALVRGPVPKPASLVRVVALTLTATSAFTLLGNWIVSDRARLYRGSNAPGWIDAAVGRASTTIVASGVGADRRNYAFWEAELFNTSIRGVYQYGERLPDGLATEEVRLRGNALYVGDRPLLAEYVLSSRRLPVIGRMVGRDLAAGLALYEVQGDVRLRTRPAQGLAKPSTG